MRLYFAKKRKCVEPEVKKQWIDHGYSENTTKHWTMF
jgi:hypothetical protein